MSMVNTSKSLLALSIVGVFAGSAAADKLSLKGERLAPKEKRGRLNMTFGDGGKQLVVIAPPVYCKPCATQLGWLQQQSAKLLAAGIAVIVVVPRFEAEDRVKLQKTLDALALSFDVLVVDEADEEALLKAAGGETLPTSMLFQRGSHQVLVKGWSEKDATTLTTKLGLGATAGSSVSGGAPGSGAVDAPAPPEKSTPRTELAASVNKLAADAAELAKSASSSTDPGARKTFAPEAVQLGQSLTAVGRLLTTYTALKILSDDMKMLALDAKDLVNLADEIDDKALRKSLRARAEALGQGMAKARTAIDDAAAKAATVAPTRFTGRLVNSTNKCASAEPLTFVLYRDGDRVFVSSLLTPGKDQSVILDEGTYLPQLRTTGRLVDAPTLWVTGKDWVFESGCIR